MTDFALGTTFDIKFTTRQFSTGAPFTLAGSPTVVAYPDDSTAEITAGITLSIDFDGRTGLNNVRVVATGGNGYAAGSSYALVVGSGTVDSVSVAGEVIGDFTIERSAAFGRLGAPAGASVSADVAAVKAETASIQSDTNDIQTRLPAALIGGRMDSNMQAAADGVLTAAKFAAGAFDAVWTVTTRTLTAFSTALAVSVWDVLASAVATASSIGLQIKTNLDTTVSSRSSHTAADVWAVGTRTLTSFGTLVSDTASAVWDRLTSALTTVGSIGKLLVDNVNATISSRSSHTAADIWAVGTRTLTSFGTLVADTATAVWAAGTRTLTSFGTLVADTATAVWAAATRTLSAFSFTVSSNVTQVGGDTGTLDRLKRVTDSEVLGTVGAASTTTSIVTSSLSPSATVLDQFKGRVVLFDRATATAGLRGQGTRITGSSTGGVLTIEALTTAPASGDLFTIV